ncbi:MULTISPECIES: hypothetical protein [Trichocoleus]|uniref:Malate dehydrogenase n=1 Tax=Trichocoleus desertorum GB2-A4 TaxID=2933944 RepID=A0ABV0J139_9CYAN|nr:hypothetical protein [Trichocoleus sp. FACHB-46]MBD1860107.1 hypothetical protein [Trichocoleus sp. FACHB-46]
MSSEPNTKAIIKIEGFKARAEELKKLSHQRYGPSWKKWHRDVQVFLEHTFGVGSRHIADFNSISYSFSFGPVSEQDVQKKWIDSLSIAQATFESFVHEINEYGLPKTHQDISVSTFEIMERLLKRFHLVARQLKERHGERSTLQIEDEYDVQDLLHSLLKLYFDDIRPEEVCPSYAGSSSRVDFLLKPQRVMLEVKKTRKSLEAKEVGEQLIIDTSRYSEHPDVDTLICFVYDPELRIGNPKGLAADLERRSLENLNVKVLIFPE